MIPYAEMTSHQTVIGALSMLCLMQAILLIYLVNKPRRWRKNDRN